MSSKTRSEDVLGEKWDRCLADTAVKMLGGEFIICASLISLFL